MAGRDSAVPFRFGGGPGRRRAGGFGGLRRGGIQPGHPLRPDSHHAFGRRGFLRGRQNSGGSAGGQEHGRGLSPARNRALRHRRDPGFARRTQAGRPGGNAEIRRAVRPGAVRLPVHQRLGKPDGAGDRPVRCHQAGLCGGGRNGQWAAPIPEPGAHLRPRGGKVLGLHPDPRPGCGRGHGDGGEGGRHRPHPHRGRLPGLRPAHPRALFHGAIGRRCVPR